MRVEELRNELLRIERVPVVCDYEDPKVGKVHHITHRQISAEQLDALIAAAREEGEQIEKARHLDMNPETSLAALEALRTQTQRAHDLGVAEERERITAILDDIERHGVVPFLSSIRQRLSLPIYDWRAQTSDFDSKKAKP